MYELKLTRDELVLVHAAFVSEKSALSIPVVFTEIAASLRLKINEQATIANEEIKKEQEIQAQETSQGEALVTLDEENDGIVVAAE